MTTRGAITELSEQKFYESKRIRLTSPLLHIGGDTSSLSPIEYIQDQKFIYLPNQDLLAKVLRGKTTTRKVNPFARPEKEQITQASQKLYLGLLNDYVQAIRNQDAEKVKTILQQALGKEWQNAIDSEGNELFPQRSRLPKWTDRTVEKLRPMIRNGFGNLYIPGSSIKGAIRTAIAYRLLKHQKQYNVPQELQVSAIEERLRLAFSEIKQKEEELRKRGSQFRKQKDIVNRYVTISEKNPLGKDSKQSLMNKLLSDFSLIYEERNYPCESSNSDLLRFVKTTDSSSLFSTVENNLAVVVEVVVSSFIDSSAKEDRYLAKSRGSIYAEVIHNVQAELEIRLDNDDTIDETTGKPLGMMSWFRHRDRMTLPFQTIEQLLSICQEFAQVQWNHERQYWQGVLNNKDRGVDLNFDLIRDFYRDDECPYNLRLGWASGMMGTTIDLLLEENTRNQIRNCCGRTALGSEAPKSRRTVRNRDGEIAFALGWVNLEVL